jgi:hypothetical protein
MSASVNDTVNGRKTKKSEEPMLYQLYENKPKKQRSGLPNLSVDVNSTQQYLGMDRGRGNNLCLYFFSSLGCDIFSTFVCKYLSFDDFVNMAWIWSDIAIPFLEQNPEIHVAILKTLSNPHSMGKPNDESDLQLQVLLEPQLDLVVDTTVNHDYLKANCKCFLMSSTSYFDVTNTESCVFNGNHRDFDASTNFNLNPKHSLCFLMYMWIRYRASLSQRKNKRDKSNVTWQSPPYWLQNTMANYKRTDSQKDIHLNTLLCSHMLHTWIKIACIFGDQAVLNVLVESLMNDVPLQHYVLLNNVHHYNNNPVTKYYEWCFSLLPFYARGQSGMVEVKVINQKPTKRKYLVNKLKVTPRFTQRDNTYDVFAISSFNTNQKNDVNDLRKLDPIYANMLNLEKSRYQTSLYVACVLLPQIKQEILNVQNHTLYKSPDGFIPCFISRYWLEIAMKRHFDERSSSYVSKLGMTEQIDPRVALMNMNCPVTYDTIARAIFWEDLQVLEYGLEQLSSAPVIAEHHKHRLLYLLACRVATTDTSAEAMICLLLRYRYPIRSFFFFTNETYCQDYAQMLSRGKDLSNSTEELYIICKEYPRYAMYLFQQPCLLFESILKRNCLICPEITNILCRTSKNNTIISKEIILNIMTELVRSIEQYITTSRDDGSDLKRCALKRFGIINPSFPRKCDDDYLNVYATHKELLVMIRDILQKIDIK